MKKMKWIMLAAGFVVMGTFLSAQTYTVHHDGRNRDRNEFERYISRGERSGELTDREIYRLRQEWEDLQDVKWNAFRNGYISHREKRRIWEAEKDFEHKLHSFMNNRERDHHRKYDRRHRDTRHDRCDRYDRNERYDRH